MLCLIFLPVFFLAEQVEQTVMLLVFSSKLNDRSGRTSVPKHKNTKKENVLEKTGLDYSYL